MKTSKENIINIILAVVLVIMGVAVAMNISGRGKKVVKVASADVQNATGDWSKLTLVLDQIQQHYVDTIDQAKITEEILPLILSKLDPHSVYLEPEELQTSEEDLQADFEGIGIVFNVPNDTAIVNSVVTGGPSEKVGILSGDRILKVDDRVIAGVDMPQDSMVRLMRGKKGSKVIITVGRDGHEVPFEIIRDKIPQKSVDVAFMVNDTTGYIKLSKFSRSTYVEFLQSELLLMTQGMKKLVFDLRDNSGGYLDQALLICNEFLEEGKLAVYMEGLHSERQDIYADNNGFGQGLELAILINEFSASSSEIFTGAMQDNDRATVYGVRSFGKGLVQEPIYFSDGSAVRLTIARYYTPTGRCIQKPYSEKYEYDILERYERGEMMCADSIKVDKSLKYTTPGGRVVYGGGGIIPDVFVPLDTTATSDFLTECNRGSLQVKFANKLCDQNRAKLRSFETMEQLEAFFKTVELKNMFVAYAADNGVMLKAGDWERSGDYILTTIKALVGRSTSMGDNAFYPIYLSTDKTFLRAVEGN